MIGQNISVEDRITKARIQLLVYFPFYGTLALALKVSEKEEVGTAGVDGTNFYYNKQFIEKLTDAELNWLVAHEVLHCALGHIWRGGSRDSNIFNQACDYAIHSILMSTRSDNFQMPKGGLYNQKFDNLSAEEIYELLPKNKKDKNNSGDGSEGQGTLDNHGEWKKSEAQQNANAKEKEWRERMISAAEVAENKKQGSVPGQIGRLIGKLKKPQKNWRQLLAEFVQFEVFDYGFMPPDKRYYGLSDVLMPDFNEETEKIQDMVFVIDTSGSIGDREMVTFFSELVGMMQQFSSGVKGHIIYADAEVAAVYDFEDVDDILKAKPAGGGGTDFRPAFEYCNDKIEKDEWNVAGLVYLTDGYGSFPNEKDVNFKTLWLSTTPDMEYPFGQVAYIKIQ